MSGPSTMPAARALEIDVASHLVEAPGDAAIGAIEDALRERGLTLGLHDPPRAVTVDAWLADGAAGAPSPFDDPADHLVAGLVAVAANGERLVVKPAPRRSVGPDLVALVFGQKGRYLRVESAWLRVFDVGAPRVAHAHRVRPDPAVTAGEEELLARIGRELGG